MTQLDTDTVLNQRAPRRQHPGRHLATRNPRGIRAVWCPDCRHPVLRGLDEDAIAFTAIADYAPLTTLGEALAWLGERRTYELRRAHGVPQLQRRDRYSIQERPPGTKTWCGLIDVLPAHQCGSPPLPGQPTVHPPTAKSKASNDDRPPF